MFVSTAVKSSKPTGPRNTLILIKCIRNLKIARTFNALSGTQTLRQYKNNNSIIHIKHKLKRTLFSLGTVFTTVLCVTIKKPNQTALRTKGLWLPGDRRVVNTDHFIH